MTGTDAIEIRTAGYGSRQVVVREGHVRRTIEPGVGGDTAVAIAARWGRILGLPVVDCCHEGPLEGEGRNRQGGLSGRPSRRPALTGSGRT